MDITKNILDNVTELCRSREIKIGALEKAIGVSLGYFARIKRDGGEFGLTKVVKTCEYLNVSLEDMIYKKVWIEREIKETEDTINVLQSKIERLKKERDEHENSINR